MQTHSVQSYTNRFDNVQAPFAGFAGGRESPVRPSNYLTPFILAGQRPVFSSDVHSLTKSIQKEISTQYLQQTLAVNLTQIEALEAAGFVHTPDMDKLHRAVLTSNLSKTSKALSGLLNTALSNLKHAIVDHVKTVFTGIDGLEPYLEQVFSSGEIYGLQFETDNYRSAGTPENIALKLYAKPFMEIVFLDLPLEGEGKEITPFLWNTVSALVQRGGGVICEDVFACARGYMIDHASEEVMAWLTNAIIEIECSPYDESVSHLFDVECPKLKVFIEEVQCSHWVFEEADSIDDIERDSLLDALNEVSRDIEAMLAHVPYTKGAPTDKAELLNASWPDHPITPLIRGLLQRHCDVAAAGTAANDSFLPPDDMYYPFPFILHPSKSAFSDGQSEVLNGVYEESMNVGEGFEWYKLDVTNGQWLAQLKDYVTCTCATVLACNIISGHFTNEK
jgi:hypothetical protein